MTNWFEQYYQELSDYALAIIKKNNYPLDPCDLVNDAYIKFVESGEEFNLESVRRYISGEAYKEHYHILQSPHTGGGKIKKNVIQGDQTCTSCHEVKNVNEFRLYKCDGRNYIGKQCKKCLQKARGKWLNNQANREKWNAYMLERNRKRGVLPMAEYRKRVAENKKGKNPYQYQKEYVQKQREQLTDKYIRHLLKCGNKDFSPEAIQKKRIELMEKRRLANSLAAV